MILSSMRPLAAQRVLELPVRTTAGADALAGGPIAVFWNPGAARIAAGRGEAVLVNVRGPASTALDGIAIAGSLRLDPRTFLSLGYQHIGIDDIEQTTTSPLPEDGAAPIDIAENVFAAAATRSVGERSTVGVGVQYVRGVAALGGNDAVEIGVGFSVRPPLALQPTLAAAARADDGGPSWMAGVEVAPDFIRPRDWSVRAHWGVVGSPRVHGLSHRVAAVAEWSDRLLLSLGVAGEPGDAGRTWDPLAGAAVRLSRYVVGVLREELPNGVGAVHTFRLSVTLQ